MIIAAIQTVLKSSHLAIGFASLMPFATVWLLRKFRNQSVEDREKDSMRFNLIFGSVLFIPSFLFTVFGAWALSRPKNPNIEHSEAEGMISALLIVSVFAMIAGLILLTLGLKRYLKIKKREKIKF